MNEEKRFFRIIRNQLGFTSQKIISLTGGWRKKVFLIKDKEKKIICFIPQKVISKSKLLKAVQLEEKLAANKIVGGRKLISFHEADKFWLMVFKYLPGKVKWHWGIRESIAIGKISARLHQAGICHLDLKPGNILWDKNNKIAGVIDFEEAKKGDWWQMVDLANTLSWLLVSGEGEKEFFESYQKQGLKIDMSKINKHLPTYLKKRLKEGYKQAFLLLAQRKLAAYKNEIQSKLLDFSDLAAFRRQHKNKKIVFSVGAFELIHYGHFQYLRYGKKLGDLLVVGIVSDKSRQKLKGKPFPIIGEQTRRETLAFFKDVDAVVIVEEEDVTRELKKLKPDVFLTVARDWREGVRKKHESDLISSWGGKVVKSRYWLPGFSSSQMIEKVALLKIKQTISTRIKRQPMLKLKKKIKDVKQVNHQGLKKLGEKLRQEKKIIVFTSLSADLFHLGHARFIQKAKSLGDVLVIGVPSNRSIAALKGFGRPIIDEQARALVLTELDLVDYLVIFDERTILGCLQKLKPDVFFTVKEDWNKNFGRSPEAQFMKSISGRIVRSERQAPYLSASKMIDKAAGEWIQKKFSTVLKTAQEAPVLNADFDPHSPEAQLTARERGFYQQVLASVAKKSKCVFCDLKDKYLIAEKDGMVLTVALFPYIDGHLLVIPRRHLESVKGLGKKEWQAISDLSRQGIDVLKKSLDVENVWFLVREGKGIKSGKTVGHLHFHLLPYNPQVIKMSETKLTISPLNLAQKLRKLNGKTSKVSR